MSRSAAATSPTDMAVSTAIQNRPAGEYSLKCFFDRATPTVYDDAAPLSPLSRAAQLVVKPSPPSVSAVGIMPSVTVPLAVGTGVVVIVVAIAVVLIVLIVAVSMRGRQQRTAQRRAEDRSALGVHPVSDQPDDDRQASEDH
jgi:hypothetical protein